MRKKSFSLFLLTIILGISSLNAENGKWLDAYNIVWNTPSINSSESMPLGGGDIGCNVWVENGMVYLYMQRSGCFSENGEFLKLGRVKLDFTPNPLLNFSSFNQTLKLIDGSIYVSTKEDHSTKNPNFSLRLWVDIFTHSIHIEINAEKELEVQAEYQSWRTDDRQLKDINRERYGCFGLEGYPGVVWKRKNTMIPENESVLFYHRNDEETISPNIMLAQQNLTSYKHEITNHNTLLTFGGRLYGSNFSKGEESEGIYCSTPYKGWSIKSKLPKKKQKVIIATHMKQCKTVEEWMLGLDESCLEINKSKGNKHRNKDWWHHFWERSRIITDVDRNEPNDELWEMGRNYQLFRYQLACNLYGEYPTKFNGGNFVFDPILTDSAMQHDPDWRQWGGDVFTAQNQRLIYWPMLKSGDFDGMKSQFNLYEWGLPGAILKTKTAFGHAGAFFCEYANASGLDMASGWGWLNSSIRGRGPEVEFGDPSIKATNTYYEKVEKGVMSNGSIAYHWESQVEHSYMMLEYNRFTGNNIDRYLPFIKNALIFFDEHYQKREEMRSGKRLDSNGKILFFPSTSCESYRGAKNPTDLIAGLTACLQSLITLTSDSISTAERSYFSEYLNRLPNLALGIAENGDSIYLPAESYIKYYNVECPQFYPLFPFNQFNMQSKEVELFKNTWKHGSFPKNMVASWHQDGIFFARMGMIEDAYNYNLQKLKSSERRFPTFWGPGHDWVPDHNWGGSGMIGLQEMLLQTINDQIFILSAWPKGKDVSFRLHAPKNTILEVEYKDGEIKQLKVHPQSRKRDVVICL